MVKCEYLQNCHFFNGKIANLIPVDVESMRKSYCLGDNTRCARYQILKTLGREYIPDDLAPNQVEISQRLIEAAELSAG